MICIEQNYSDGTLNISDLYVHRIYKGKMFIVIDLVINVYSTELYHVIRYAIANYRFIFRIELLIS
jgi:hypothetical protein